MSNGPAVNVGQLKQFVEQIERLEEDKAGIAQDINDKYKEAESTGYDKKALRQIIRLRKKSATEREEEVQILETYMVALGMEPQTDATAS